jgi:DNA-binding MarR family transcriptional regulator
MSYIKTLKEGGAGFVIVPDQVTTDSELTFQQMKVILALCAHAANATGRAAPSVQSLCERTGMARENVSRTLTKLVEMRWIKRERMGHGFTNVYHITVEARMKKLAAEKKKLRQVTSKKRSTEEQAIHVEKIRAKIAADAKKAQDNYDKETRQVEEEEAEEVLGFKDIFDIVPPATESEIEAWPRKRVMDVGFSKEGPDAIPEAILKHHDINPFIFF